MNNNLVDMRGRRFERLRVLKIESVAHGHAYWRCKCDCGATVIVRGTRLRLGKTVSCGCWRADPAVRQAARLQMTPARRRAIAKLGGVAVANSGKGRNAKKA